MRILIDVCLFNWETELDNPQRRSIFMQSARYRNGILDYVDLPLREPPTGLMLLAAVLESKGYSVEIVDATLLENVDDFLENNLQKFRVIGFTGLTNTFPFIEKIIQRTNQINPEIYIILGGPHASFQYEEILQSLPEVDLICIGEAENTFPWVVERLLHRPAIDFLYDAQSESLEHTFKSRNQINAILTATDDILAGVAYRNAQSEIIYTGFPLTPELITLPLPARHLISRIYSVADILVNRGCPNRCSFCSRTRLFPKMRLRSLESVLEELDYVLSCGNYRFINFYDNINIKTAYFERFLKELIARPHMLPWGAELRSDVISLEQADLLKQANCQVVATGIESASDIVLKTNFKFQNLKAVRNGIENLKSAEIAVQAYFVIGLPGDTPQEFAKTLSFLESLPLQPGVDKVNFFVATPYPGCDLRMNPEKYHISLLDKPYTTYNCREIQLTTDNLGVSDIKKMIKQAKQLKKKLGLN